MASNGASNSGGTSLPKGPRDDDREHRLLQHILSLPDRETTLRGNPAAILSAIDSFSATDTMLMNVGPSKGKHITDLIESYKPAIMIELGGYVGYSAILLGNAVRAAGGKKYLSLEFNDVVATVARQLLDLAGLSEFVEVIIAPSYETLIRLVRDDVLVNGHIDVLLFDHWKDRYLPDLWLVENLGLLKPGHSVLVADNVIVPGAPEYLEWVNATTSEAKKEILKKNFSEEELGKKDIDLATVIKESDGDVRAVGVNVERVPGDPDLVYETQITYFDGSWGGTDGVTITKVLGKGKI